MLWKGRSFTICIDKYDTFIAVFYTITVLRIIGGSLKNQMRFSVDDTRRCWSSRLITELELIQFPLPTYMSRVLDSKNTYRLAASCMIEVA